MGIGLDRRRRESRSTMTGVDPNHVVPPCRPHCGQARRDWCLDRLSHSLTGVLWLPRCNRHNRVAGRTGVMQRKKTARSV